MMMMVRRHYEDGFDMWLCLRSCCLFLLCHSFMWLVLLRSLTSTFSYFFFQTPSEPWSSSSSTGPNLTTDSRTRAWPSKASWSKTSSCISPWTESLTSSRVSSSTLCSVRIRFTLTPSDCYCTRFFFWTVLIRSNLPTGQLIERVAVLLPHLFSSEKIYGRLLPVFVFGERTLW